ncbi:MAG: DUF6713 family protein [Phormidesmis sp.]
MKVLKSPCQPFTKNLLFQLGFSTLITHELDAVAQSEWKILFVLRSLSEPIAASTFVAMHVPLVAILLYLTHHKSLSIQYWSRTLVALFLVVHAGLHKRLEWQHSPNYTFDSWLSVGLIMSSGILGFIYLVVQGLDTKKDSLE